MDDHVLNLAQIVNCTEAEGPGKRFAIWFQGCPLRCASCCNPEMLPFVGGYKTILSSLIEEIKLSKEQYNIEGITLLGGEPTAHIAKVLPLIAEVKKLDLTIMVFSGYTLEEINVRALKDSRLNTLIHSIDILVDGPYIKELPETKRRWIGSSNQKIHFLSNKYKATDDCWKKKNTLELRLRKGELTVNGFPVAKSNI